MRGSAVLILSAILGTYGCSSGSTSESTPAPTSASSREPHGDEFSSGSRRGYPRIVVIGDSLTAGLGLPSEQTYLALLQRRVDDLGLKYDFVNAGVSGDTSAGGLR